MAFDITNKGVTFPVQFIATKRVELADLTATSAGQDMGAAYRSFRALIYQKAFTAGTGTRFVTYSIDVADNSAMSTNLRTVATGVVLRADEQTLILFGQTPFVAGQQFARVGVVEDGTDAATFDAVLESV